MGYEKPSSPHSRSFSSLVMAVKLDVYYANDEGKC